jgi:3-isopropylmalate/(R)-2-methylmalate dehydratase small subunit
MSEHAITSLSGTAIPIRGDEIDTDRIVPARCLKEITFEKMGEFLFVDAREDDAHPLNNTAYQGASCMIVGWNFGCGSSREHAPQAVKRYGVTFLIGKSFAEIFGGNCKALGMPAVVAENDVVDSLWAHVEANPDTSFSLDLHAMTVTYDDQTIAVTMRDEQRNAFLEGTWDAMSLLKANMDLVRETAARLPHMQV